MREERKGVKESTACMGEGHIERMGGLLISSSSELKKMLGQSVEAGPFQWLGEDISQVVIGGDIQKLHISLGVSLPNVEISNIYVLCSLVVSRIL